MFLESDVTKYTANFFPFACDGQILLFLKLHTMQLKVVWGLTVYTLPKVVWGLTVYTLLKVVWGLTVYTLLKERTCPCLIFNITDLKGVNSSESRSF